MLANSIKRLLHALADRLANRRFLVLGGLAAMLFVALAVGSWAIVSRNERPNEVLQAPVQQVTSSVGISVFPDFSLVSDVDARKRQFFDYIEAYANAENQRISETRHELLLFNSVLRNGHPLSTLEHMALLNIAEDYRLEQGVGQTEELDSVLDDDAALVEALLLRVDEIPVSLALAQAANESAWGTSRFAVDGNNLFGEWCYVEGCGFVPYERANDASHEVRRFETIAGAVSAYFHNLNTHPSYVLFRRMRARMREQERSLDPIQLAYGLGSYSQRGDSYIDELQTIIQQNDLHLRDEG